jgi:ATP-dependent helicase Lhr and Lhr-like helicase
MNHLLWIETWFKSKDWTPRDFQFRSWKAYLEGMNGFIHVSTGYGKTLAACMGALSELALESAEPEGIHILYVTPLRALSSDIIKSLLVPIDDLALPFTLEKRTGDSTAYERSKQKKRPPSILITTPESFNLLLASVEYRKALARCRLVVVDEWHELVANKRGVQIQLCLSHLRKISPGLRVWGLSATIGNPDLAAEVLFKGSSNSYVLVSEPVAKEIELNCLPPDEIDSFPWAGHLGMAMVNKVINHLDLSCSTLLFTNTRNQAERWFSEILQLKPEWQKIMGLHHSSVDRETRQIIEEEIKNGKLKIVVCTSGLDLGVDFPKVQRVYQIGSPKSISRFVQRAGRSGHTPDGVPHIIFVPTYALEIFEYLALELAIRGGLKEELIPPEMSFDVLAQHLCTLAADEGLKPDEAYLEISSTYAYRFITPEQFENILDFLTTGGRVLSGYSNYHKLKFFKDRYLFYDKKLIQQHLMNLGTITSEAGIKVQYVKGSVVGTIEESFIGRLKKGDVFVFAGKALEYVMLKDLTVFVRSAASSAQVTASWGGSYLALSHLLATHLKEVFELIRADEFKHPLVEFLLPIIHAQKTISSFPGKNFLLIEQTKTKEGNHLFLFPFEGRSVHEALASLLSVRMSQETKVTFSFSVSEYGLEILAPSDYVFKTEEIKRYLTTENLMPDIQKSLNMTQLAKKQFREIAQISGLIQQRAAGDKRTMKNLQMSSSLLFDVFSSYGPEQLLYQQSFYEVRFFQFQEQRLRRVLTNLESISINSFHTSHPSPLAFPLIAERIASRVSSESIHDRLNRMKNKWIKK